MERIIGAFIFPDVWQRWTKKDAFDSLEALAAFGVNAILTEAEIYRDDLISVAHQLGLKWLGGISCFSDHTNNHRILHERSELWPILETGEKRPLIEWYIGITPTIENYNQSRLDLMEHMVSKYELDGLFLDFIRWPIHWELELRPGAPQPLQSSFDSHTIGRFEAATGIDIPQQLTTNAERAKWILANYANQWNDFRCNVITEFVHETGSRLRGIRSEDFTIGLFSLPLPPAQLEQTAGQRLADLHLSVDFIAPMAYHAILHRPITWVSDIITSTTSIAPGQVLPVLQIDTSEGEEYGGDWGPRISVDELESLIQNTLATPDIAGLITFTGTALFRDQRGEVLKRFIRGKQTRF